MFCTSIRAYHILRTLGKYRGIDERIIHRLIIYLQKDKNLYNDSCNTSVTREGFGTIAVRFFFLKKIAQKNIFVILNSFQNLVLFWVLKQVQDDSLFNFSF
jgi:hypothetical protein